MARSGFLVSIFLACMCAIPIPAQAARLDLFAPNAAIAYDALSADYSIAIDFFTLQALHQKYGVGISISLCELQIKNTAPRQWSFFPIQFIFNPVNYDELLWVYLYAGAKLLFASFDDTQYDVQQTAHDKTDSRSNAPQFVGTLGARFALIPHSEPKTMYRQHSVNVFLEYSTQHTFSVGISLPAEGLSYLVNDWLEILSAEFAPPLPPAEIPDEDPPKTPREE